MSRPVLSEICPLLYKTVENPVKGCSRKIRIREGLKLDYILHREAPKHGRLIFPLNLTCCYMFAFLTKQW